MKVTKYFILSLLMILFCSMAEAQQRNVLQVPDTTVLIGNAQLPVIIENTDEIVGAQFDLVLPEGITIDKPTLSDRTNGHTVTVKQLSTGSYRVLLHSATNKPLIGQSGPVIFLPLNIPDSFEEGSQYQLVISNAVLGKATGENVITDAVAGTIKITKMPRLTLSVLKTELYEGEKTTVTITSEIAPTSDLVLTIGSNSPERLKFPETVVMAAGSFSASFEVEVLQDAQITDNQKAIIAVTADGYYSGEGQITLLDDDKLPTVETNKTAYKPGETVLISGQMYGLAAINAKVAVYVVHNGTRERLGTSTDGNGKFSVAYNIPSSQSGHFVIEACLASEQGSEELASFDTFGIQLSAYSSESYLELGVPFTGSIVVTNTVTIKQTGLRIEQLGDSVNTSFKFSAPETIEGNSTSEITFSIIPNGLSEGNEWQQMPIEITTAEGAKTKYIFYYYVQSAAAALQVEPTVIETTMTKGATREYPVVITNIGKGETGKITISAPDFIKASAPGTKTSLAGGESVTVLLELSPTEDMTLNVPVTGNLTVNCQNGNGQEVKFSIEPVSENTGSLRVDVTDELTYYAETVKPPHVKDAKIEIKHPVTREVVSSGLSDENGLLTVEIAEGLYLLEVSAEKHETFRNQIMIDPGKVKNIEAFLSYQNVTYDWNVVETEVEDSYNIELVADYDVRIPKPALDVKIAIDEQPVDGSIIPVEVTNMGLININNVNVTLDVTPKDYQIEFLNNPFFDYLAPHQKETVYAKVKYNGAAEARRAEGNKGDKGVDSATSTSDGKYPCGDEDRSVNGGTTRIWDLTLDELSDNSKIREKIHKPSKPDKPSGGGSSEDNSSGGGQGGWSYETVVNTPVNGTRICFDPADPDGPGNPNRPDDPIDLDIAPSGDPNDDVDCDSKKEPTFVYNLVPVTGTQYKIKGVAADGVSQLKIILDPNESHIPKDDCNNFTDFSWYVDEKCGKIEGNSFKEAIYTAPDSFPENHASYSWIVEANMSYTHHYNNSVSEVKHVHVQIEIIRPPVVFIHGLNDTEACWKELDSLLINSGLYRDSINYRVDYTTTNTYSFAKNVPVVGLGIQKAQRRALCKGYVATKCDLVGHSMGGILARLYAQNGGVDELNGLNRIITVNTPHAGSEIASTIMAHDKFLTWVTKIVFNALKSKEYDYNTSLGAVRDLAVESDAIHDLNSVLKYNSDGRSLKPEVPVYAIATSLENSSAKLAGMGMELGLAAGLFSAIAPAMEVGPAWEIIGIPLSILIATYVGHVAGDDLPQVGIGDWVVSTQSQIGGCESKTIIENETTVPWTASSLMQFVGASMGNWLAGKITSDIAAVLTAAINDPWHVKSPKHGLVMNELKNLLSKNAKDAIFSKSWFTPEWRSFEHNWSALSWGSGVIPWSNFIPFSKFNGGQFILPNNEIIKVPVNLGDIIQNANDKLELVFNISDAIKGFVDNVSAYVENNNSGPQFSRRLTSTGSNFDKGLYIQMRLNCPDGFSDPITTMTFGERTVSTAIGNNVIFKVPSSFSGDMKATVFMKNEDESIYYDEYIFTLDEPLATPVSLTLDETTLDVDDSEPLRLYCTWNDGTETKVVPDSITFEHDNVAALVGKYIVGLKQGRTKVIASYRGITCEGLVRVFASDDDENEASESVCSKVTLAFKQEMVTTRQAFRGTLTVNNGSGTKQLKDLKLNLEVKDEMGNVATEHEFQIDLESLDGFEGELNFTSGWSLNAESKGTATILFVPTKFAAPTEPKKWLFGGTFSYTDPDTDLTVTRELYAVPLTVNPTAELDLDYFLQRDVFGDDPLTEDVVENSQPAEFALLINNKGYGDAQNVNLVTHKPEIVDNEKGLLIDFDLISSQLNGGDKTISFSKIIPTDFGTIAAHSQSYAQWWLQSSLLGHFVDYDVSATHVTSRDNPDLSLLDQVKVHELIHGFTASGEGEKLLRGFLVNDIKDSEDKPDAIYFTDATQYQVNLASEADVQQVSDSEYVLNIKANTGGWIYGSLPDPTGGLQKLVKVTRTDGSEVFIDNIWQTDRILRDGKDPLYENLLHFVAYVEAESESLNLFFQPKEDISTGVFKISDDLNVKVSPLPLRENMRIIGNFNSIREVSLYDMRGIRVFRTRNVVAGQDIPIGRRSPGIYYIQVLTDKGTYRAKVQKL